MTAVFARHHREFAEIRFMPAKNFIRITRERDLYGILLQGFWENKDVKEAYDVLFERQHELFTLKK
jgi:hypothetical protein